MDQHFSTFLEKKCALRPSGPGAFSGPILLRAFDISKLEGGEQRYLWVE